jgi:hypothetical protein
MRIALQYQGQKFNIYAIVCDDESCPVISFLDYLRKTNTPSHRSLVSIYTRHADHGQLRNIRKSRPIKGHKNLFEFKSTQGDRLLYFYLPDRKTVLTHGFHKGAPAKEEYDRAERMREQYREEVGDGY